MKRMVLLVMSLLGCLPQCLAQDQEAVLEIEAHRQEIRVTFAHKDESPLTPSDRKKFTNLEYYPIDLSYRVNAQLALSDSAFFFNVPTSMGLQQQYSVYGILHFSLQEIGYSLPVYQNKSLLDDPEYEDYLWLPFTDLTNGETTYGGGRYIELRIPEGDALVVDFNQAYNPYCAYSDRYSCPLIPSRNHLSLEIKAGVKAY